MKGEGFDRGEEMLRRLDELRAEQKAISEELDEYHARTRAALAAQRIRVLIAETTGEKRGQTFEYH